MRRMLLLLACILLLLSMWMSLTVGEIAGPTTHPDSVVRNILYAHVPSSMCALFSFVVLLIASIGYLRTNNPLWDITAAASAEVGAVLATISNISGMIFSRAEWNIWWTPSPRLITTATLWFLYIVYLILRASLPGSHRRRARICAVFGIIAFLDVPMVIISARFMPDIHRARFLGDPQQKVAFWLSVAAMAFWAAMLIWFKADILKNKARLEKELIS